MKIAIRCLYHYPITPDFHIIDLEGDEWHKFLWADRLERIEMMRLYLPQYHPSVREVSWIVLNSLSAQNKADLIAALSDGDM